MHAKNDWTIPITHARRLFQILRDRDQDHAEGVQEVEIPNWGVVRSFNGREGGHVMFWEADSGGHNELGWMEGGLDLVRKVCMQ